MICEKKDCTGCFACYNICPKNAITFIEDENGFVYPTIDNEKCINCKLCEKVCPSINKVNKVKPNKCFAVYSKNEEIRNTSTSGGIATTISKEFIKQGGIVYGAAFENECNVNHIRVDNEDDLLRLQGSKYVHSYINDTYRKISADLKNNLKVLFFGTPCQVAGLKNYLMGKTENLSTIDIVCHGVPSQKYLKEEVSRLNKDLNIDRVNFRNGNKYGFFILKNNKIVFESDIKDSPYCYSFMHGLSLRENCYNCLYSNENRVSEITIGDFWGLNESSNFYADREKGVSIVAINNAKGEELFNQNKELFFWEERDYEEGVKGNSQLRHPTIKNKKYECFKKDYIKYGFLKAYKKNTRIVRIKKFIKSVIKK